MSGGTQQRFLDTSALVRRAMAARTPSSERDADLGARVEALVQDGNAPLAISELVIMEFRSVTATVARRGDDAAHDFSWHQESIYDLMGLVHSGRLQVVGVPANAALRACTLIDLATEDVGIALHVWDAVHIITCLAMADALAERVTVTTADDDFQRFVTHFPHFGARLDVEHLVHEPSPQPASGSAS